jgi:oligoendopeptidase F
MIGYRISPLLALSALVLLTFALAPAVAQEAAEEQTLFYENRQDIPLEYRWDLDAIFPNQEAWQAELEKLDQDIPAIADYSGRLGESAEVLAAALEAQFALARRFEDVYVYAMESLHTNTADTTANDLSGRARALAGKLQEAVAFVDPEIVQLPEDQLHEYLRDPVLEPYTHYLDNVVRTRDHILSPEIEGILAGSALPGSAHQQAFSSLQNADIEWPTIEGEDGEEVKVVPGQYIRFLTSDDRRVRREGALALLDTYTKYANTFAATLGGSIQRDTWMARTRGYETALDMSLDATNVPKVVVDTLVGAVHDNIEQIQSYATLRKELLGLDEQHIYDFYVNVIPGVEKTYTYEQGWDLAMEFWRETFGEEYAAVAKRARKERWVDVYSNQGKQPGAYSWGTYNSHPYLFLNWDGSLEAVSTLVHEMGHSIHTYLANHNQPYHDSNYSLFVAEVGSVASESLFLEWLYERSTDPAERKLLLNQAMYDVTGTFVRQIFFHEWEAKAHAMAEAGEPLTKESLGEAYGNLWKEYYGADLTVDDAYKAGWARVSHFYRTFYVWVYATSYAAGEAIAQRFRDGDETAVQDYLAMLKLGGSVYPMEALARAGVDMSDPTVIRAVMDRYGELQGQLRELMAGE